MVLLRPATNNEVLRGYNRPLVISLIIIIDLHYINPMAPNVRYHQQCDAQNTKQQVQIMIIV